MISSVWWRRAGRELARAVLDVVAPPGCPACGEPGEGLCAGCRRLLERRDEPVCGRCGEPLAGPALRCPDDHRWLAGLRAARAPFRYAGAGGTLVRRLKFERELGAGWFLARHMVAAIGPWVRRSARRAVVAPVPMHAAKRRARGFDQAAWLADVVARELGLRLAPGALRRTRRTLPQGDPRVTSRERNVDGAFAVARPRRVRGRTVLLVDDTVTSGATVRECARVLRAAGAHAVAVVSAVRA